MAASIYLILIVLVGCSKIGAKVSMYDVRPNEDYEKAIKIEHGLGALSALSDAMQSLPIQLNGMFAIPYNGNVADCSHLMTLYVSIIHIILDRILYDIRCHINRINAFTYKNKSPSQQTNYEITCVKRFCKTIADFISDQLPYVPKGTYLVSCPFKAKKPSIDQLNSMSLHAYKAYLIQFLTRAHNLICDFSARLSDQANVCLTLGTIVEKNIAFLIDYLNERLAMLKGQFVHHDNNLSDWFGSFRCRLINMQRRNLMPIFIALNAQQLYYGYEIYAPIFHACEALTRQFNDCLEQLNAICNG